MNWVWGIKEDSGVWGRTNGKAEVTMNWVQGGREEQVVTSWSAGGTLWDASIGDAVRHPAEVCGRLRL